MEHRHTIIAALALAATASCAASTQAADFSFPLKAPTYAAPAYNWTGFYFGAHAGYAVDDDKADSASSFLVIPGAGLIFDPNDLVNGGLASLASSSKRSRFEGAFGGLQAGYNHQFGWFVIGTEADVSFSGLSKSIDSSQTLSQEGVVDPNLNDPLAGQFISVAINQTTAVKHELGTFGTIRGRIGATTGRFMFYGTGGVAFADLRTRAMTTGSVTSTPNIANNPNLALIQALLGGTQTASVSQFAVGMAVGGGVEAFLTDNVSLKAEYLYYDFPATSIDIGGNLLGGGATYKIRNEFHTARVGVNYHF